MFVTLQMVTTGPICRRQPLLKQSNFLNSKSRDLIMIISLVPDKLASSMTNPYGVISHFWKSRDLWWWRNRWLWICLKPTQSFSTRIYNVFSKPRDFTMLTLENRFNLFSTQRTQTSLRRLPDILKRSRHFTTKQDLVTTSGKRRWIDDVLKTSDLRRLEDV